MPTKRKTVSKAPAKPATKPKVLKPEEFEPDDEETQAFEAAPEPEENPTTPIPDSPPVKDGVLKAGIPV